MLLTCVDIREVFAQHVVGCLDDVTLLKQFGFQHLVLMDHFVLRSQVSFGRHQQIKEVDNLGGMFVYDKLVQDPKQVQYFVKFQAHIGINL